MFLKAAVYCVQGTSDMSKAANYPRSKPDVFPELTAPLSSISTVHVINMTVWCWTEQDIRQLYGKDEQEGSQRNTGIIALASGIGVGVNPPLKLQAQKALTASPALGCRGQKTAATPTVVLCTRKSSIHVIESPLETCYSVHPTYSADIKQAHLCCRGRFAYLWGCWRNLVLFGATPLCLPPSKGPRNTAHTARTSWKQ